ncbi:MAG: hypothetical protein AAGF74_13660 [Pseudomonadota bacterium]
MSVQPFFTLEEISRIEADGGFRVSTEAYGVSVRPGAQLRRRATMVEWSAYFLGFLTLFATVGIFFIQNGTADAEMTLFEGGIAMVGASFAAFFFWVALRGTAMELQVDSVAGELRMVVRSWRDTTRVLETYALSEIEDLFVIQRGNEAHLCVRTEEDPDGVETISGDEGALGVIQKALNPAVGGAPHKGSRTGRTARQDDFAAAAAVG